MSTKAMNTKKNTNTTVTKKEEPTMSKNTKSATTKKETTPKTETPKVTLEQVKEALATALSENIWDPFTLKEAPKMNRTTVLYKGVGVFYVEYNSRGVVFHSKEEVVPADYMESAKKVKGNPVNPYAVKVEYKALEAAVNAYANGLTLVAGLRDIAKEEKEKAKQAASEAKKAKAAEKQAKKDDAKKEEAKAKKAAK